VEAPLALYRRYRPDTFAQVIGQDHVTGPLRAALRNNRVNHAYLFSGPRGCGKTTSARILARALNCAQGPTEEPCGECASCRELATGGPGSVDVIEIDAASHGGVDDARELREQATFRPMRDRYKIYIIDEAHMVSRAGFNALLKIVEEPPEHVRFIFATTEPEKVIGTVRSRTHHYPFRLIPPKVLGTYLGELCAKEGVAIEAGALPLVVRAGGGSARDTLSILDQLISGAGPDGVTYSLTAGLLGFTPDSLLDEVVDGLSADDGAAVFDAVDKVVETGQDPARFVEDLLRRLRDLVIVSAVPDASATGLIDVPEDVAERLTQQAARFGRAELTRAAEIVADGLSDMKGTTPPRMLLELLCARLLLPGAEDSERGLATRIDRLERRLEMGVPSPTGRPVAQTPAPEQAPVPAPAQHPVQHPAQAPAPAPAPAPPEPAPTRPSADAPPTAAPERTPAPERQQPAAQQSAAQQPAAQQPVTQRPAAQQPAPAPDRQPAPAASAAGGVSLVDVRRLWPDLLDRIKGTRRFAWMVLSQHAQAVGLEGRDLTLGFNNAGARQSFVDGGNLELVRQALIDLVGADLKVEAIMDPSANPGAEPVTVTRPAVQPGPPPQPAEPPAAAGSQPTPTQPPGLQGPPPTQPGRQDPAPPTAQQAPRAPQAPDRSSAPSGPSQPTPVADDRPPLAPPSGPPRVATAQDDADASRSDEDLDDHLDTEQMLSAKLGAQVIEEIPRG
jgi:DNA polymerase-3 subunit gamma/tau